MVDLQKWCKIVFYFFNFHTLLFLLFYPLPSTDVFTWLNLGTESESGKGPLIICVIVTSLLILLQALGGQGFISVTCAHGNTTMSLGTGSWQVPVLVDICQRLLTGDIKSAVPFVFRVPTLLQLSTSPRAEISHRPSVTLQLTGTWRQNQL